jgi:hypothetical protein
MGDTVKLTAQLKRTRKTALVLSALCMLLLMFSIFKHIQTSDAVKLVEEQRTLLLEEREKAAQLQAEAERQRILAEEQRALALNALEKVK